MTIKNIVKLQNMIDCALEKDLEPGNISELVKLLEYYDKLNSLKCDQCQFKMRASSRTISDALKEFLSEN